MVHTHWNITVIKKKEWNSGICNNMDGPRAVGLSEIRQISYYLYVESKKMNNKTEMDW